jgi:hypothetical protein
VRGSRFWLLDLTPEATAGNKQQRLMSFGRKKKEQIISS